MGVLKLLMNSPRMLGRALTLFRDSAVPVRLKVLAVLGTLFIISPLNILGDIPLLGIFDDAALFALLLSWFVRAGDRGMISPRP